MTEVVSEPTNRTPTEASRVELLYAPALKRNSLTTFFRLILAIPHFFVMAALLYMAMFVSFIGWVGALFNRRLSPSIAALIEQVIGYAVRVNAYLGLLTDVYPPFHLSNVVYPFEVVFPERPALNRWAVFFRFFLMLPALVVNQVVAAGVAVLNIINWFISFITGKTLPAFYEINLASQRFTLRLYSFGFMLTSTYPGGLFGDGPRTEADLPLSDSSSRTKVILDKGRTLLIVAIVIGIIYSIVSISLNAASTSSTTTYP